MADDLIPDDIKGFISQHIDSIVQLEALLLLRASRELKWNTDAVADRLYVKVEETLPWLERLSNDGFLVSKGRNPPRYKYQPRSAELEQTVDRLAHLYAKHLVPVTHLIHSKPRTRVQEFADAFKLKKD